MLTIYNTTVPVKDQAQADRLKQICIDYGLPIWDNPSAFIYNKRYCYFRFQGSAFWISSYALQQFSPLPEITEQQFIELLKNMKYKGYTISEDMSGFAPKNSQFSFFLEDGEKLIGSGYSVDDCKKQIDEIITDLKDNQKLILTEKQIDELAEIGNKYLYLGEMGEGRIRPLGIIEIIKRYEEISN